MNKRFKFLSSLLMVFALTNCKDTTPSEQTPKFDGVDINPTFSLTEASTHEINPFVYGTFIEHIGRCIYTGIWAEIINDRKFVAPINQDVSQWTSDQDIAMETTNPYQGKYSPILKKGDSIKQTGLGLKNNVEYNGYLYAKGTAELQIKYYYDNVENLVTIKVNSSDYKKYEYSFVSDVDSTKAKVEFICTNGSLTLDSVSLMPSDNYHGMRKDTLDILKELNAPFYRWPGGNFVSGYDFYDGIGERDLRETKRNLHYAKPLDTFSSDEERLANDLMRIGHSGFYAIYEPNDYGIEEFILMCKYLNAEPNIVVNSGLGDSQMAADEVEFCNSSSGYGLKRIIQKEPYNIKYWSIGNEMNGDWQLGHMPINEYTKKHNEFATKMKEVDPNIKLIAVGDNWSDWTSRMVSSCKNNMDYTSEHYYATRYETDVKKHIQSLKNQTITRISKHRSIVGIGNIKMAIDEYAYENAESTSRLKDGMGVASALNEMQANADVVKIACYSSTVNATQGNLLVDKVNAYMEGSGYALSLYRNNCLSYSLPINYRILSGVDYYEISATTNKEKNQIVLSVINTGTTKLRINNNKFDKVIKTDALTGLYLESINNQSAQELTRKTSNTETNEVICEPYSITLFTINLKK